MNEDDRLLAATNQLKAQFPDISPMSATHKARMILRAADTQDPLRKKL